MKQEEIRALEEIIKKKQHKFDIKQPKEQKNKETWL
jgi:hypothetical protein